MTYVRARLKGFSLLEILLVLAIMSTVMMALLGYTTQKSDEMRRDRTVIQIQQILNAGLAYYVNIGAWPTAIANLQGSYLPSGAITNPWGNTPSLGGNTTSPSGVSFSVCSVISGSAQKTYAAANIIAGRLPMASAVKGTVTCPISGGTTACTTTDTTCTVVSSVTIPGQNLNNARSINFAGLYHNGACVPAPVCPSGMTASIMVIPVSVAGMQDPSSPSPLASFTAYANGGDSNNNPTTNKPYICGSSTTTGVCDSTLSPSPQTINTGTYWRVCLTIQTEEGQIIYDNSTYQTGVVLALTRCQPSAEPSGSDFTVFTP